MHNGGKPGGGTLCQSLKFSMGGRCLGRNLLPSQLVSGRGERDGGLHKHTLTYLLFGLSLLPLIIFVALAVAVTVLLLLLLLFSI